MSKHVTVYYSLKTGNRVTEFYAKRNPSKVEKFEFTVKQATAEVIRNLETARAAKAALEVAKAERAAKRAAKKPAKKTAKKTTKKAAAKKVGLKTKAR